MKRISILLFVVLFMSSCANSSKSGSSSDLKNLPNEVRQWVENNTAEMKQLREHWKTTIKTHQEELSSEFTSSQEQLLWAGKILEVLELDWTEQERRYLETYLELIVLNPDAFSKDENYYNSEEHLKMVEKAEELEVYATEELGWDKPLIWNLFYTLAPLLENKQIEPKREQWVMKEIDGVFVPHVVIDDVLVPWDSIK